MGTLTGKIENLSPQELQALADRLLAKRPKAVVDDARSARPARVPLSFSQEGLWLLEKLGLGGATYNECLAVRLTGVLRIEALQRSLGEVVRRHEALRTRFVVIADQPCQVVQPAPDAIELLPVDLSLLPPQERECKVSEHLQAQAAQRFDLESGPLYRASLVRVSEREHILCWVVHHMLWDGWSTWLFLGEMTARYAAHVAGVPLDVPALDFQYADFALRQRLRAPAGGAGLLPYWRKQLAGVPPTLDLPTDRPRQSIPSLQGGARVSMLLEKRLVEDLQRVAREAGVTLHMLTLAAFKVALFRWSGITDVVVGTPITGRTERGSESLIGYFTNMLVMRTRLAGDLSFQELLSRVKTTATGAFDHQDLPFGSLVSGLSPPRLPGRNPVFQVCFALHDFHGEVSGDVAPGLQVAVLEFAEWKPKFELDVNLARVPEGITVWFSYPTDLFDRSTIERWMGHYERVLRVIVQDLAIPIARIPLVDGDERLLLLEDFQPSAAPREAAALPHELFEERTRRNPSATALVCDGREWSFATLNSRANRLAHVLIARGVRPDIPVGVCSPGVADFVISLLAVLKAGGACVPLRPASMAEELAGSALGLVLVSGCPAASVPGPGIDILRVDDEASMREEMSEANPGRRGLDGHHLACIVSILDSSGERRRVMIEHRGVGNLVQWFGSHFPSDRFPQWALKFQPDIDGSLIDVLAGLAAGAAVHTLGSPLSANDSVPDVPLLCATAAAVERLADDDRLPHRLAALVIRGGRLSRERVERLFARTGLRRITFMSGFPETAGGSVYFHVDELADAEVAIRRPVGNTRLYVLDAQRELAPIGVYGELCIGGAGAARGYLNEPHATARCFAADPFDSNDHSRIFFTGRRARWTHDGSIELDDSPEKLPLTESRVRALEQQLAACEYIRDAAVVADTQGNGRLVVYAVPQPGRMAGRRERARPRWEREHVAKWRHRASDIYDSTNAPAGAECDATGWVSRCTRSPFNPLELREAIDETVLRIKSLAPRRVLEIGCGTGLVLRGLASACEAYTATDLSPDAVRRLRLRLAESSMDGVELYELPAHEIGKLPPASYDTVVLDAVVQCFPSAEYLLAVLQQAIERIMPTGRIFIGGVRHLPLLGAFNAAVELHQAADAVSIAQYRARVQERMRDEDELALSPRLFTQLARRDERIADVQIHLRKGCYDNELTQFHYDVILHVGAKPQRADPILLDGADPRLCRNIAGLLRTERPARLLARDISNARLVKARALYDSLDSMPPEIECVAQLREFVEHAQGGIDPQLLWNMGEKLEYDVHLDWSAGYENGSFDAIFSRPLAG